MNQIHPPLTVNREETKLRIIHYFTLLHRRQPRLSLFFRDKFSVYSIKLFRRRISKCACVFLSFSRPRFAVSNDEYIYILFNRIELSREIRIVLSDMIDHI